MIKIINIAVLGSTKGTDLQAVIDAVESKELDAEIKIVISNKENAYILVRAESHDIKTLLISQKGKTREEFDREVMEALEKEKIDLVLLIGYMRILSKEFVEKWGLRTMNVHPSLLPKFAGGMDTNVHEEVLKAGEKESGMTIHFISERADDGPIIIQKRCRIDPDETIETLKEKVQKLEGKGFVEAIKLFAEGRIKVEGGKVIIR